MQGLELPRLIGGTTARDSAGSGSHTFGIAIKVISTVFLSVCLIVASFYVALFFRKWKQKRGEFFEENTVFFSHVLPVFRLGQ